ALSALCDPIIAQRHEASERMANKLIEAGYAISWEQVERFAAGSACVYKQHIMHALMESGYCEELFGQLYRRLFTRAGDGGVMGSAYVPMRYADAREAIRAVIEAGGVPVLAHPGQLRNFE